MEDDLDGSRSFTPKNGYGFFFEIGICLLRDTKLEVDHDLAGRMGLYPF